MRDVEKALAAIAELDPRIGAFTGVDPSARGGPGPLAGIPIAVKELCAVEGLPWQAGSLVRAGVRAERDATAVAMVRAAGAAIVGVTATHEFAWGITSRHETLGGPRNPWNTDRIAGGSSGGSAAAVASGIVPAALGTDTGCSIREPASFCGVVGFKPTYGIVPTHGVIPLAPSLDHVGVIADEVATAARVAEVMGVPATARLADLTDLRIGVTPQLQGPDLPRDRRACLTAAEQALEALGATLIPVQLPAAALVAEAYRIVQNAEAFAVHSQQLRTWPSRRSDYSRSLQTLLAGAADVDLDGYRAGVRLMAGIRHETGRVLSGVDLLLTPVSAAGPSRWSDPDRSDLIGADGLRVALRDAVLPYTQLQNVAGLPACSVPAGLDADGLPVGVQITGRPWGDPLVLAASSLLRDALRGRIDRRPTVT
jgi:aspartyl-tRNA(Asn)/glutamyl-tRNA(Gln) amidotransferase subunit A